MLHSFAFGGRWPCILFILKKSLKLANNNACICERCNTISDVRCCIFVKFSSCRFQLYYYFIQRIHWQGKGLAESVFNFLHFACLCLNYIGFQNENRPIFRTLWHSIHVDLGPPKSLLILLQLHCNAMLKYVFEKMLLSHNQKSKWYSTICS